MLFLQSRISWRFVDHSHYLVIQLIGKNTSSEDYKILFHFLILILLVFTCFFYLNLQYTVLWRFFSSLFFLCFFPYYFFLAFFVCLFVFFFLHISCTSFSLRESTWAGFETLLELWQVLHLNFRGFSWRRESNKTGSRDLKLLWK